MRSHCCAPSPPSVPRTRSSSHTALCPVKPCSPPTSHPRICGADSSGLLGVSTHTRDWSFCAGLTSLGTMLSFRQDTLGHTGDDVEPAAEGGGGHCERSSGLAQSRRRPSTVGSAPPQRSGRGQPGRDALLRDRVFRAPPESLVVAHLRGAGGPQTCCSRAGNTLAVSPSRATGLAVGAKAQHFRGSRSNG